MKVLLAAQPVHLEVTVVVAQVRLVIPMVLGKAAMESQHLFQEPQHFMQVAVVAIMLVTPAAMAAVVLLQQVELLIEAVEVVLGMEMQLRATAAPVSSSSNTSVLIPSQVELD
jgi:hypothetical protein